MKHAIGASKKIYLLSARGDVSSLLEWDCAVVARSLATDLHVCAWEFSADGFVDAGFAGYSSRCQSLNRVDLMKSWERTAIAHASLLGGCVALCLQGVQVGFGLLRDVDWVLALVFGRHVCGFVDLGRWLDL